MSLNRIASCHSWLAGSLITLLIISLIGLLARPVMAHEAKCPFCKLDVVQDTKEQDNEVALKYGRKRIEYRCIFCALTQAHTEYKGDLTVLAPSEIKGKPIVLTRKDSKWSASPENPVFVAVKVNHRQCHIGYRAFTKKDAYEKWVKNNAAQLKDAKPLTLAEMLKVAEGK